jgi:replicative DNA helicase
MSAVREEIGRMAVLYGGRADAPAARIPPHSIEAEQAVLGAVLLDGRALAKVSDWLAPEDFYRRDHQLIYRAIIDLAATGKPCDPITLAESLEGSGVAEQIGGSGYVLSLGSGTFSAANVVAYAEIVLEKSRLRQAIDIGMQMADAAYSGKSSSDLVAMASANMAGLQGDTSRAGLQPIKVAVGEFFRELTARYESGERYSGRLTPWHEVNELTLGLKPADLIVIGGRPGMGKSVMGFGAATFDALRGGRTAVFSLEMSAVQFVEREVAAIGEIEHEWLRRPVADLAAETNWAKTAEAIRKLVGSGLLIDDMAGLTIEQICARARRAHLQAPLTMVVIDHLHIVKVKGGDNMVSQLGDISRGAKRLAKELRCPVVLLAQLNRGNESRTDKRPTMADLRGSGEIEQDADYILLLHREDYYDEGASPGLVELIVGKARHARKRSVALRSRLDQMRFDDWEGPMPAPAQSAPKANRRGLQIGKDAAAGGDA